MKVPHSKSVANHAVPESCGVHREVRLEALTGVRAGQPLSRVRISIWVPTLSDSRKATRMGASSQALVRPAWSKTLACTHTPCTGTGISPV